MTILSMGDFTSQRDAAALPWIHLTTLIMMVFAAGFAEVSPYPGLFAGILFTLNGIVYLRIVLYGIRKYRSNI
jgi:hypothetical protein